MQVAGRGQVILRDRKNAILGRYLEVKIFHCFLGWLRRGVTVAMSFTCLSLLTYKKKVIIFNYKLQTEGRVLFTK